MSKENLIFHTFGCKVNTYDTGLLQKQLGLIKYEQDVHIFNTCAVTANATKDAIRSINKIKTDNPNSKIVVTGCSAQVDTEQFEELESVDLIVANSHKDDIRNIITNHDSGNEQKLFKSNIFKKPDFDFTGGLEKDHTRSFLKIQDGCNSFCAYCVIPFTRGKSRCVSVESIVKRILKLEEDNIKEVVITGIHLGDYKDGDLDLAGLLKEILKQTSMPRIRLTSLEPQELTDELKEVVKDPRICSHFHMSIQSANNDVLKLMKRVYQYNDIEHSLNWIENNIENPFVGMDVIVGFPNETEELFSDTYNKLSNLPWTKIHVFPYSVRPSTYAERLEDVVSPKDKVKRSKMLRDLSTQRYKQRALNQTGTIKELLILAPRKGVGVGLSNDYWNVFLNKQLSPGTLAKVKITDSQDDNPSRLNKTLTGVVI